MCVRNTVYCTQSGGPGEDDGQGRSLHQSLDCHTEDPSVKPADKEKIKAYVKKCQGVVVCVWYCMI